MTVTAPRGTRLAMACAALRAGELVAYPTEAVFGLGCDPHCARALQALVQLKFRDRRKGLILIASDYAQLREFVQELDGRHMAAVLASWPGPNTWILPASPRVHPLVSGGRSTVAVRVTAHPVAAALCRRFGGAIVSTSANRSGAAPAVRASEVRRRFGARLAFVLGGAVGARRRPSTIRDARTGQVIRDGEDGGERG